MSSALFRYSSSESASSSAPVMTRPVVSIPRFSAIAVAVFWWSPVIIITFIPASIHSFTDFLASFLGGSISPSIPVNVMSFSTSFSSLILYAHPITLRACPLISSIFSSIVSFVLPSSISILPSLSMYLHLSRIISGAPFDRIMLFSPSSLCIVVIILRLLSRGISSTLSSSLSWSLQYVSIAASVWSPIIFSPEMTALLHNFPIRCVLSLFV